MAVDNYALILRTGPQFLSSKTSDCTPIATITDIAQEWDRNTLWNGGCDIGTFVVYDNYDILAQYWQSWLGLDILEVDQGIKTWNGQIQRVELYSGSVGMARDMSQMFNSVRSIYTDEDGEVHFTAWFDNDYSQAMYGVREEQLDPPTELSTDVIHQINRTLELHGWPPRFPCDQISEPGDRSYLKVYVSGYLHTLNNRVIVPSRFGWVFIKNVDDVIDDIIDDSDYVNKSYIAANNHAIYSNAGDGMKYGDFLLDLLDLTDTSENIYHGWIDANRQFRYEALDLTPQYYIKGGKVWADAGAVTEISPRHVRPGVFRVLDFPVSGADKESIFFDRRDVLIEDISVDALGTPSYKPRQSEISDYIAYMSSRRAYLMLTGFMDLMGGIDSGGSGYTCTE